MKFFIKPLKPREALLSIQFDDESEEESEIKKLSDIEED